MRTFIVSLLLAGVAASAMTADVSAQTRRKSRVVAVAGDGIESLPLTVNKRSWLDPGPVAPRGTGQSYMTANTVLNRTQDRINNPDLFGNGIMQGQPYVPGRTVPVVEFSSLPNGGAVVENVLGEPNAYFNPTPPEFPPASPVLPTSDPYLR